MIKCTIGKLGRMYRRMLCKHPILVQSVQTGALMGTADVIAQKVVEEKCEWDYIRTVQFAGLGMLTVGPALTLWYRVLSRLVRGCGTSAAIKKMALDQLIFAPSFLAFFLVAINTIQGKCWDDIQHELECKYPEILLANYKVWPVVQLANFTFVPLNYQVLLVQTVALFWNTYLSWKSQESLDEGPPNAKKKPPPPPKPKAPPKPKVDPKKCN